MRRYRLFEKRPGDDPWFMIMACIMDDSEDLCIGEDEREAGALMRWLNERGCLYHIEVVGFDPSATEDEDACRSRMMFYQDYEYRFARRRDHYDLLIYDDATATLMSLFHEKFVEIIPPEVLAARAAEAQRLEEKAAQVAAWREKEDAENARRIAKGKAPIVSAIEVVQGEEAVAVEDQVAPPTRAWLQGIAHGFNKMIFGEGYERQRQREKPL